MNSMLELTDYLGLDYYFVSLSAEHGMLVIRSLNNYCKPIDKTVIMAKIEDLTFGTKDQLAFVCFDYEGEHYHFINYGNHLMPFLRQILPSTRVSY